MGRDTFVLDCALLARADAGQVDGLARLQIRLRRRHCELRLANPSRRLVELIDLCGLAGVLPVEAGRQAEEGEEPGGVEEERELGDPPV